MKKSAFLLALAASAISFNYAFTQDDSETGFSADPIAPAAAGPEKVTALKAPLEATVKARALRGTAIKHSFTSGTKRKHINLKTHHTGFEPMSFRRKFRAKGYDMDRVILDETAARDVAEGFYDGARVRVYHPVDGKLVKIRDCVLPEGAHQATGWFEFRGWDTVVPKGKTSFKIALDSSFRPDRDYWFAVRALDSYRQWSDVSNVVKLHVGKAEGQKVPEKRMRYNNWSKVDAPDKPEPPPAPRNLRHSVDGDIVTFTWDPSEGDDVAAYGLVVSPVPPERQKGFGFELPSREPRPDQIIQTNDIVFVDQFKTELNEDDQSPYSGWPAWRNKIRHPFAQRHTADAWSDGRNFPAKWALVEHPGTLPEEFVNHGKTCLKWEVPAGEMTGIYLYAHSTRDNGYYPVIKPVEHKIEAWVRGKGKARIMFSGPYADTEAKLPYGEKLGKNPSLAIAPIDLPLEDEWRKVTRSFTPADYFDRGIGNIYLVVEGPATLYIDDLKIYEADVPAGEYDPLTLQRIRESDMRFSRLQETVVSPPRGYGIDGMFMPAGHNNYSAGHVHEVTLYTLLHSLREVGNISPWIQLEMCLSEDEWLAFAEWFCAPYDPAAGDTPEKKPYAYRRWKMGQKKPWVDEFEEFAFEISNETWNKTFAPYDWDWGMTLRDGATGQEYSYGGTYGLFNEYVIEQFRKSPYWTDEVEAKAKYMLCGWQAALGFGADAARHSPSADIITYAAYSSNRGLGDPKIINDFKRFMHLQWARSATDKQVSRGLEAERNLAADGRSIESGIYEYGYGYNVGPGKAKEKEVDNQIGRSLVTAVFVLDACLTRARAGYTDQAYFTFGHITGTGTWGSHTTLDFGGHAYPFWKALTLYNRHGGGRFLDVTVDSSPEWDFPAYNTEDNMHSKVRRPAMKDLPLISVYATTQGDRVTVFLLSRKLDNYPIAGDDGYTPASITLPFRNARKATLYKLTGDPRTDDRYEELHKVEEVSLNTEGFNGVLPVNSRTGADNRGLPPCSIFCYVFEGTDIGQVQPYEPEPVERRKLASIEIGDETWRALPLAHERPVGKPIALDEAGDRLVISAAGTVGDRSYPVLAAPSRYRTDFTVTAKLEAIEEAGNAPQELAGLVLVGRNPAGRGFSLDESKNLDTHAAVLVDPAGAVSIVSNRKIKPVLPAGSVTLPARLRIAVDDGVGTAAIEIDSKWKDVATVPNLRNVGLMPALTVGSGNRTVTINATFDDIGIRE